MQTPKDTLGIIIQWGNEGWTGGPNYLKNLALAVKALPPSKKLRLVYFVLPHQISALDQYQAILPLADDIRLYAPGVRLDDIDVLYPFPIEDDAATPGAKAYWIPDFQHCYLPEMFSRSEIVQRNNTFARLAQGRDMVVLSSQAAQDDFYRFFPVTCPTHVLRFATSPEPGWLEGDPEAVTARFGIESPYLMCCNQFWAHKDHRTLFEALALLRERGIIWRLVCTGSKDDYRNPDYFPSLVRLLEEKGLADQVKILGLIDRADQVQLLRGAAAVVQPSRFEGWSTVIEDCRLLGKTVIYSDIPVHLEQAIPGGLPFHTGDPQHLAAVLQGAPEFTATAGTATEQQALAATDDRRLRFGLEIVRLVANTLEQAHHTPPATADVTPGNCFQIKGKSLYAPPLAGASTLAAYLFTPEAYAGTLGVLKLLDQDEQILFWRGFLSRGLKRFGANWRYADIRTACHVLAGVLAIETCLEIGTDRGDILAMVVACRPGVRLTVLDVGGPEKTAARRESTQALLTRLGHTGNYALAEANSPKDVAAYFSSNRSQSFDMAIIDGDTAPQHATTHLIEALRHIRIGGVLIFGDVVSPDRPDRLQIWRKAVTSRPDMTGFEFTELGHGVALAVRMR
ncbi:glycosyl transferase group 1 [Solidesulfovibrio fructosivorans JJ]]|uniref:Glycosyl transferase group 1 n=1 Tax=Solidesulfovibrio fructosivorans JJ] TaxID=596151 RepID=E1JXT4_SOLFR|nr:glycosyltransferase [Solidesulfovibrio fructosivorans]EFL50857.1 glycosyl transferase group 1 [Solidesulfovibrio fructosivorans JJ]]